METFSHDVRSSKPPKNVLTEALAALTGPLSQHRYMLTTQGESGLTFARKYRPWWVWVLTIVTFPIGLLWLLSSETASITVVLDPDIGGTVVPVTGMGEPQVRRAFESMELLPQRHPGP